MNLLANPPFSFSPSPYSHEGFDAGIVRQIRPAKISKSAYPRRHSLAFSRRVRHLGRLLSYRILLIRDLILIHRLNECRGRRARG